MALSLRVWLLLVMSLFAVCCLLFVDVAATVVDLCCLLLSL